MDKDIFQVEFFMPNGEVRKYVVGEEIDEKTTTRIDAYDGFIRVSFVEMIMHSHVTGTTFSTHLTVPTSIPYTMSYTEGKPWYAQPRY